MFTKKKVVFIVADGSKEVIPLPNGYYKPEVINWVDEELNKYNNKNVVILQHYPLIPPTANESRYTYKADEYLKMLEEAINENAEIQTIISRLEVNFISRILKLKNMLPFIPAENRPCYN